MKKLLFWIGVAAVALPTLSQAQSDFQNVALLETSNNVVVNTDEPNNGIYVNESDYRNQLIKLGFDAPMEQYKIHQDLFSRHLVLVEKGDKSKITFDKHKIWGFRKDGEDYRTIDDADYKIEYAPNQLPFVVYSTPRTNNSRLFSNSSTNKDYYFSRTIGSAIYPVSLENIEEVYSDLTPFVKALDEQNLSNPQPVDLIQTVIKTYINVQEK